MDNLSNTGERQHADSFDMNALEHLHRYAIAASLCCGHEVLDIASGEGYGSNILAGTAKSVIGVDISEDAIAHSGKKYARHNLRYISGSADRIPLPDHSVDRVISFETLEHHDRHEEMFFEIKRVLRPGGLLMISTPDKLNYTDTPKQHNEFHVKELYLDEFRALAQRHFRHISMHYQRVDYIGLIVPESLGNYPFRFFKGGFQDLETSSTLPEPIYNICLATDGDLPEPSISAYSGHPIHESLRIRAGDQAEEIDRLQKILGNARNEIDDLRKSPAFMVGRAITAPYRMLRNLFN